MSDINHSALLGLAAAVALGFSGVASAAPQWCIDIGGPPCTGGPGGGEEAAGNNLSLPTLFVPSTQGAPTTRIPCPSVAVAPGEDLEPPTFPPEDPVYWVQKTAATWSATCDESNTFQEVNVSADWGDNLTGDAPAIKTGKPLRVEVSLTETNGGVHDGYEVLKLTDELDRLATYGTDGTTLSQNYRVWDAGASLTIETCADTSCTSPEPLIEEDPMVAEINSIGAVVYGYNWGIKQDAPDPGIYKLTFYANNTVITSVADAKASLCTTGNCTYVIVTLTPGGGGGGGNPNRQ